MIRRMSNCVPTLFIKFDFIIFDMQLLKGASIRERSFKWCWFRVLSIDGCV